MSTKDYILIFFIALSSIQTGYLINDFIQWREILRPAAINLGE